MAIGTRTHWFPVTEDRRLLIGLGNPLRGDDAAGLLVARQVRRQLAGAQRPPGADTVEILELEGEPVDLIEAWEGAAAVVLADAVASGVAPGTIHRLDAGAEPLPAALAGPSTHALGLAEAIELARALDRLPPRLVVLGIEGARFDPGAAPTRAITAAVAQAAARALQELSGT